MSTGVNVWSKTAATNNTADGAVNWQEGQAPSSVNNSARGMMAAIAKWRDDLNGTVVTSGSSTAYVATSNQGFASLNAGIEITCQFDEDCGATVTLNVDGLGAKPLRSAANVELVAGAIKGGSIHRATYFTSNSGEWILHDVNPTIIAAGQVVTASITDKNVTYAKIQDVSASSKILGRKTAAAGVIEECALTDVLDMVGSATRGDILVRGASAWGRVALGTQGQVMRSDGADLAMGNIPVLHAAEEQANNTASTANLTAATWSQLVLNTTRINEINSATVSSNQVSLPAGTYEATLTIPSAQTGSSSVTQKGRLRNVTDGATLLVSPTQGWNGGGAAGGVVPIVAHGRFTLSGTKTLQAQFYQNTGSGFVLGGNRGTGYAEVEIYTELVIKRIA